MTSRSGALALAVLMLNLSLVGPARAQSPAAPQTGVLLLRGGDVLQGSISRVGDRYIVAFAEGGEVRLPTGVVEHQAASVDEIYRWKLSHCDSQSAPRQLELADWCLQHGRLQDAAERLLAATLLEPQHPGIRGIETRLWLATHPPQASATREDAGDAQAAAVRRAVESLPPGAIESFVADVQPLLLNRCAGCHRPGSRLGFQLMRPLRGRIPPRSFTERNLAATLSVIDRAAPRESPLLVVPGPKHCGTALSDVPLEAEQVDKLADWIESLTRRPSAPVAPAVAQRETVLWQPAGAFSGARPVGGSPQPAPSLPDAAMRTGSLPQNDEGNPPQAAGPDGFRPRDPFDPEIFNRRYFPPAEHR